MTNYTLVIKVSWDKKVRVNANEHANFEFVNGQVYNLWLVTKQNLKHSW